MDWKRVNNDVNGNPRYVCHFLALSTPADAALPVLARCDAAIAKVVAGEVRA